MKDPSSISNYFFGSKYFYHRLFVEIASECDVIVMLRNMLSLLCSQITRLFRPSEVPALYFRFIFPIFHENCFTENQQ